VDNRQAPSQVRLLPGGLRVRSVVAARCQNARHAPHEGTVVTTPGDASADGSDATPGEDVLTCPPPRLTADDCAEILRQHWGIDPSAVTDLPSERDLNAMADGRYVLKVSNPAESAALVDLETEALAHAARADPGLPLPRAMPTLTGPSTATVVDADGRECLARVITVLPGAMAEGQAISARLAESIGAHAARMSIALQGLFHPAAARVIDWDVRRADAVLAGVDPQLLDFSSDELSEFRRRCAAAAEASLMLPSGLNHADLTLTNILIADDAVTGLIDLGDMHHTANVCDLAVTLTSVIRNTAPVQAVDTWQLMRAVVTGYQRERLLLPAEVDILGDLVLARLALSRAISARRVALHEDNTAYIAQYDDANDRVLRDLRAVGPDELRRRLHRMAGTAHAPGSSALSTASGSDADLLSRRRAAMGGLLSPLFYSQPLEVVRGEGPWLFTADGRRYLDAYNNVAVIGHAHPAVTQAVTRQLAAVNTHSRYLHTGIVELAERLLATMPAELDTCLFTTSGTEANELAWRLATAYSGGSGAIIAEHAYHGSSKWFADLSSNEWPPGYRPAHVATFAAPRVETGGTGHDTAVARILGAAEQLRAEGDEPALVLVDLGFTSEGILDAPDGFVLGLAAGAHQAGALLLADEVQAGYGRIGPPLWRFAAHGLVPDIVSLGKPMGAGYPIGAVITRSDIAASLARDYEYFSTFAATPVAAAAALAVLDTLEEGELPQRAAVVGDYLRERLRDLADGSSRLGDVRGRGLIAGVDTYDPAGAVDRDASRALLDGLLREGVLAGLTGPAGNVLKIRPPLVWETDHGDVLIEALRTVLSHRP
jgi:4-aminobutyrate aminotransferase-like enzyme/Ser/Thr protein kinase RdoA (MazF antagonist)